MVSVPVVRDPLRDTLNEWRAALGAWDQAGEPTAGPVFARMTNARQAFLAARRVEFPDERL
ncbi:MULTISPECIES: hypothetical protein [Nocardia]|uniref:hypothetical protein n=1 Tax=Nocardia TaxID=1817 RepID=UPI00130036F6|nr:MULTISPECIES: hypothetical protein [Nocardia]